MSRLQAEKPCCGVRGRVCVIFSVIENDHHSRFSSVIFCQYADGHGAPERAGGGKNEKPIHFDSIIPKSCINHWRLLVNHCVSHDV